MGMYTEEKMKFLMEHPEERFVMHPGEAQLVADDGRLLSWEEATRYWEDKTRKSTKVWEQLRIGDVVKVQDIDVPLTVEALRGDPVLSGSDYGGVCESDPDLMIMFEQHMIECILKRGG